MTTLRKIFSFFLVSFICEILQYLLRIGAFDITDIINNTFGGISGMVLFEGLKKVFGDARKAKKLINIIGIICTSVIVSTLLYLKINRLLMFRQ